MGQFQSVPRIASEDFSRRFSPAHTARDQEGSKRNGPPSTAGVQARRWRMATRSRFERPVLVIRWYSRAMLRDAVKALLAALCDLFRSRSALLAENTLKLGHHVSPRSVSK
jgi:hypothetical protein